MHLRRYFWGKILRVDCNSTRKTWKDTSIFFFNQTGWVAHYAYWKLEGPFRILYFLCITPHTSHAQRSKGVEIYLTYFEMPWADCHQWNWKVVMNGYYIYQGWRLQQKIGDWRSEKKRVNSDPERTLAAAEILHFPKIELYFSRGKITIFIKIAV